MSASLLRAVSCLCLLHAGGIHACSQTVLAGRDTVYAPAGGSLSLSCVVRHCGERWTGSWLWANTTEENLKSVKDDEEHHLTRAPLSDNDTQLTLNFLKIGQSDEGFYGCSVVWGGGDIEQGHLMHVNVTAAGPALRRPWHRVLVCAAASLCLLVFLGLARCLSSEAEPRPRPGTPSTPYRDHPVPAPRPPRPPPRCPLPPQKLPLPPSASSLRAPAMAEQRKEVLYADISQDALRQQGGSREPLQSTVYSSVRFS